MLFRYDTGGWPIRADDGFYGSVSRDFRRTRRIVAMRGVNAMQMPLRSVCASGGRYRRVGVSTQSRFARALHRRHGEERVLVSALTGYDGLPGPVEGICQTCLSGFRSLPLRPYIFCRHNGKLAVRLSGGWQTFPAVSRDKVEQWVARYFEERYSND